MTTLWHLWNRLALTTTAQTAHGLHKAMHEALTDDEIRELTDYNTDVYDGFLFPEDYRTRMRALQDRFDASVRRYAEENQ